MSKIILDQASTMFERHLTSEVVSAANSGIWPASLWAVIEDAGLPLAMTDEQNGGAGLAPSSAFALIRLAAYYSVPLPLAETMIASALWTAAGGPAPVGITTIASDTIIIVDDSDQPSLTGVLRRVPWGGNADQILIGARHPDGDTRLVLVSAKGLELEEERNLANEPRTKLSLDRVALSDGIMLSHRFGPDGLLPYGAVMRAQQMVGAMERALDHAIRHAGERRQFGREIGKFQAVQHMLADAAGQVAAAAAAADLAVEAFLRSDFAFAAAIAKARTGEAAGKVAALCHQVLGAMGFTSEHPLGFSTRRLWSWRDEFGNEAFWQQRVGQDICRRGGGDMWTRLADC